MSQGRLCSPASQVLFALALYPVQTQNSPSRL